MGDLAVGDQQRVQAVHDRRPLLVNLGRMVTWRLCSAGQVGPVVHVGVGKVRRNGFCRAQVGEGLLLGDAGGRSCFLGGFPAAAVSMGKGAAKAKITRTGPTVNSEKSKGGPAR